MMKKIIFIATSAAAVLSFAACTSAASPSATASEPAVSEPVASEAPAASETPASAEQTPAESAAASSGASLSVVGEWYDTDDAGESIIFYEDGKFEIYDQENNSRVKTDEGTYTLSGSELTLEGTELDDNNKETFTGTGTLNSESSLTLTLVDSDDNKPDTDDFISLGSVKIAESIDKAALASAVWKSSGAELEFASDSQKCTLTINGEVKNCTYEIEGGFIEVEWEEADNSKNDDHEFAMSDDNSTLYALSLDGEALTQK